MAESETRVLAPDAEMTTFVAHPEGGGPFPVAPVFMDGVGYREQVKENARRFAAGAIGSDRVEGGEGIQTDAIWSG